MAPIPRSALAWHERCSTPCVIGARRRTRASRRTIRTTWEKTRMSTLSRRNGLAALVLGLTATCLFAQEGGTRPQSQREFLGESFDLNPQVTELIRVRP